MIPWSNPGVPVLTLPISGLSAAQAQEGTMTTFIATCQRDDPLLGSKRRAGTPSGWMRQQEWFLLFWLMKMSWKRQTHIY